MSSVGETLRNAREEKGISIQQVAEATSIRIMYLEAIEKEQFDLIPGVVYLKGFIRNYANFVGLNGPELVEKYKEQVAAQKRQEHVPTAEELKPVAEKVRIIPKKKIELPKCDTCVIKSLLSRFMNKNVFIALAGVAVLFVAINFFGGNSADENGVVTIGKESAPTQAISEQPRKSSVVKDQGGVYLLKDAARIEVQIDFSDACWTEAYADGKEVFVGMMSSGKSITWTADKELQIKLGNVRVAKITCNGQSIPYEADENGIVVRNFKR